MTPALPPGAPSYPRKTRIIGLALFIGLALGFGGAIAKEKLNAAFTTPYQVEEMLELPILASAPSMDKDHPTPSVSEVHATIRFSEALRALRSG